MDIIRSRIKEIILLIVAIIISLVLLDIISFFIYPKITKINLFEEVNSKRNDLPYHNIHPFLGYVLNYEIDHNKINKFGFYGVEPFLNKSDNIIHIGIFGGSVAGNFCGYGNKELKDSGMEKLKKNLIKSDFFKHKKIVISCIALGAYKQPQQLMALNYFLMLGANFDIILNIDGFNEIRAPQHYNFYKKISLSFPYRWDLLSRNSIDIKMAMHMAMIEKIKAEKEAWNSFFNKSIIQHSNFLKLLKKIIENQKNNKLRYETIRLNERLTAAESNYQITGPQEEFNDKKELIKKSAEIWKLSSKLMSSICKEWNISYFHFLQPNSCNPNSKQFTQEERRVIDYSEDEIKDLAYAYTILIKEGQNLYDKEIVFADLTNIFKNEASTLYIDHAHFNDKGNGIMAEHVAEVITNYYKVQGN